MKKLCKQTIKVITDIIEVGKLFNIDVFIINKHGIRAKSADSRYIFLSKEEDFDFLEFDALCISRVNELKNRIQFMEKIADDDFNIYASELKELDSGGEVVRKISLISKDTSIEVTGDNPSKYSIPKSVKDEKLVSFSINDNSAEVLSSLPRAIQHKNRAINISSKNGIIIASTRDVERDYATHILSENPVFIGKKQDFSFTYDMNTLVSMLRGTSNMNISLTHRGVILTTINDINIIIFPEKLTD
jgi:hypothetical protein